MIWRFVFILLACTPAFSQQNIGDLKASLRHAETNGNNDSISYYLAVISSEYLDRKSYDSAKFYSRRAIVFNTMTDNKIRLAGDLNNLGVLHFQTGATDSSIYYYDAAYKAFEHVQDTTMMAVLKINLGILYKQKGLYE
ncbi:MAG TPA: hypothetical protein VFM90_03605, partial [Cyclobacteriaceae bacterium]|nr:hypothetical protein [Cyclobacteriaceae bacterium]